MINPNCARNRPTRITRPQWGVAMAVAVTASLATAGCFGGGTTFKPGEGFKETGRTVHLKASVIDLAGQELYPGLKTNLWAFCVEALDPRDSYSVDAVEYRTPLANDRPLPATFTPGSCSVPGPTIRVHQGDRVIVDFVNSHFHPHTIHWHGQLVPNESDGVPGVTQDTTAGGGSYTYDFIAKKAGTLWYHCHVDTQLHVMQGLFGMFIVEPQETKYEPKDITGEYDIVLSTLRRERLEAIPGTGLHNHPAGCASGFAGCENPYTDVEPDVFLINGHSFPYTADDASSLIKVKQGAKVRLRFLNAGTTVEEIHFHGHDLRITHKDGNPLPTDPPLYLDTLNIGPGERYDAVLEANNPGVWVWHTHINNHETNCGKSLGGMHSMLVYEGFEDKMHQFKGELPATCQYDSQLRAPPDFMDARTFTLGTQDEVSAESFSFPVKLVCALRSVKVTAALQPSGTISQLLTQLRVTITNPKGEFVTNFDLGGQDQPTYANATFEKHGLATFTEGNYTMTVTGRSVEASLSLGVMVDYFENLEDTKPNHLLYGYAGCPGYT